MSPQCSVPVSSRLVGAAIALVIAAAWMALAPPAQAAGVACGQAVTGNAVLTRNLTCTGGGPVMTTGNVTLDLRGHTIRGSGTGAGITVAPCGQSGTLTIRNGTVKGFAAGISVTSEIGCDHAVSSTIERLTITANGTGVLGGIDGAPTGPTLLRDNAIRANTGAGIATANLRPLAVVHNAIARNGGNGVTASVDSIDRFEGNDVARNGGHGAAFTDSVSAIVGNRFANNAGIGLTLLERDCTFKPLYTISSNIAVRNDAGGIGAAFPLCAEQTVPVPGSGNAARRNGTYQCLLVACDPGASAMLASRRAVRAARH